MHIWSFLGLEPHSVEHLSTVSAKRLVRRPGVYVLFTADGYAYRYPRGESPIFYIGMSELLCDRVDTHRQRVNTVLRRTANGIEWPRYEYAAAHGCKVAAFPMSDALNFDCGDLEDDVVALFAGVYGAPPVANGAASRDKVLRRNALLPPPGLTTQPWIDAPDA
jgi:hypothetical protein